METVQKPSRRQLNDIRQKAIKKKMAELDDEKAETFRYLYKKIRKTKKKIDCLETRLAHDCKRYSDEDDECRFDLASWVMTKTLEQFPNAEIETLGVVCLKFFQQDKHGNETTKTVEVAPTTYFRHLRSGLLRKHSTAISRYNYIPKSETLKLFMSNKRIREDSEACGDTINVKKKADTVTDQGLLNLMAIMEIELLQEVRQTKIRLFQAKAKCLELGLDVE